jgi:hypothetical protein
MVILRALPQSRLTPNAKHKKRSDVGLIFTIKSGLSESRKGTLFDSGPGETEPHVCHGMPIYASKYIVAVKKFLIRGYATEYAPMK